MVVLMGMQRRRLLHWQRRRLRRRLSWLLSILRALNLIRRRRRRLWRRLRSLLSVLWALLSIHWRRRRLRRRMHTPFLKCCHTVLIVH